MRRTIIAGNWKMNMTPSATVKFFEEFIPAVKDATWCDIVIATPFVDLAPAVNATEGTNVAIASQNVHFAKSGAYTGEISAEMLTEVGVRYAVIGHSERRQYFAETDETVNLRSKAALEAGITPIICVGEVKDERLSGVTDEVVSRQTRIALSGVTAEEMKSVIIAYEPVWAIGTGLTATPEQADETCGTIRKVIAELYGSEVADSTAILYGGSMNDANAAELLAKENVDGGLIGGASLKVDKLTTIVNAAKR